MSLVGLQEVTGRGAATTIGLEALEQSERPGLQFALVRCRM